MRWPLRLQILTPMALILLVTVGSVSALNVWLAAARVRTDVEAQLRNVARTLEATNFPLESNVLKQTSGLCGAQLIVADEGGRVIGSSLAEGDFPSAPFAETTDWRALRLRDSVEL